MVTLFCAVVGETESAFATDVDDANKSVDHLKRAIKVKQLMSFMQVTERTKDT